MGVSKLNLITALGNIAPISLAESWDNCGMQIDLSPNEIKKILVTLEITKDIIAEAEDLGVDFIVTHHPLYFSSMRKIDSNDIIGKYTVDLIKKGISVYSAHTNFDKAQYGNNYYLAKILKLKDIKNFEEYGDDYIGLFGEISEVKSLRNIIKELQSSLKLGQNEIRVIGDYDEKINKIGLCTGAGISMLDIAVKSGCQLFITGDVKYHDAIKAKEMGMNVLDAGHYGTEKIFTPNMATQLKELLGDKVEIFSSSIDLNPFNL